MIYFVRFYFMYPIWCTRTQKRLTNPKALIKVNIHISGTVKTYNTSGQDKTSGHNHQAVSKDVQNTYVFKCFAK